jgi:hypothetical protein
MKKRGKTATECKASDCFGCYHSCVLYPTYEHRDGEPFCKAGLPVTVHRAVGFSLQEGDMTPGGAEG